jgi:hypothetical protein
MILFGSIFNGNFQVRICKKKNRLIKSLIFKLCVAKKIYYVAKAVKIFLSSYTFKKFLIKMCPNQIHLCGIFRSHNVAIQEKKRKIRKKKTLFFIETKFFNYWALTFITLILMNFSVQFDCNLKHLMLLSRCVGFLRFVSLIKDIVAVNCDLLKAPFFSA